MSAGGGGVADNPVRTEAVLLHRYIREGRTRCRSTRPGCECQPAAAELPITPFAPRAVLLHRHIREDRTRCRSTRPGCECQPAAPELPITPFAPGAVLLRRRYRSRPSPTVGAPAPGANINGGSGVAGIPGSHRGRCSYAEHIGDARARCRSTRPGCECQPAAAELPITPFAPGAVLLRRAYRRCPSP